MTGPVSPRDRAHGRTRATETVRRRAGPKKTAGPSRRRNAGVARAAVAGAAPAPAARAAPGRRGAGRPGRGGLVERLVQARPGLALVRVELPQPAPGARKWQAPGFAPVAPRPPAHPGGQGA